ncbi:MAG: chromosomal replication initiator protein DnaA [Solirubrobacteraceae bacterium]
MPEHLAHSPAWQEITTALQRAVGKFTYDIWLAPLQVRNWDGELLLLEGAPQTDSWLADRYGAVIERCVHNTLGNHVRVAFAGDPAGSASASLAAVGSAGRDKSTHPLLTTERVNPRHTFEQFVIGDSNRLAHAAALAVAEAPSQAYNPLFLYASPGLGKTHLLHAIANYLAAFNPEITTRYTTVEAFTNGFIAALNGRALDRFKALHRNVHVLLIDDVQFLASKAKTEEEFFHTFNAVYDSGRQLVLTCDRLPSQLTGIERRLRDRFQSGLVAQLGAPDARTRLAILRKRANLDNIPIADDRVLELIAARVTADVRSLQGALIRVVAHHSLTGKPIDLALTEHVLDSLQPQNGAAQRESHQPTIPQIQKFTAARFNLSLDDLTGSSRLASISWPRQVAIYLSRELTDQPLQSIGRAFGGRNHATVLHACRRVSDRIAANAADAADISQLTLVISSQHP